MLNERALKLFQISMFLSIMRNKRLSSQLLLWFLWQWTAKEISGIVGPEEKQRFYCIVKEQLPLRQRKIPTFMRQIEGILWYYLLTNKLARNNGQLNEFTPFTDLFLILGVLNLLKQARHVVQPVFKDGNDNLFLQSKPSSKTVSIILQSNSNLTKRNFCHSISEHARSFIRTFRFLKKERASLSKRNVLLLILFL